MLTRHWLFLATGGLLLGGCVTHKDLQYTFTVAGTVACKGACEEVRTATVRLLDSGLDYKRRETRFEIASHLAEVDRPFRFDADYFWGYNKVGGSATPRRSVTVEAITDGCASASREVDLSAAKQEGAHFTLEMDALEIQCSGSK